MTSFCNVSKPAPYNDLTFRISDPFYHLMPDCFIIVCITILLFYYLPCYQLLKSFPVCTSLIYDDQHFLKTGSESFLYLRYDYL